MDRRGALSALAALSLAPYGCCLPGPRIDKVSWSGATPLAPPARRAGAPVTIDAHAHFFNATDVTPEGYLKYSVAHGLEDKPELEKLVRAAAPWLGAIGRELPLTAGEEARVLESFDKERATPERLRIERQRFIEEQLAPQIARRVPDTDLERAYLDAKSRTVKIQGAYTRPPVDLRNADSISRLLSPPATMRTEAFGSRAPSLMESPEGDLEFIFRMLMPRWINLMDYVDAYAAEAPGVDGAISALVDFDDWMDGETACSTVEDQIAVQELLSRLSGGFTLPLAPFNPLKDLDKSLSLVRDAIVNRGFVGVKIYPPMGFGADGQHAQGPGDMPQRMNALFTLLEDLNAVVMAHGNHSMGRSDAYEEYAGPEHWEAALKAGHKDLRVNIGHFGGTSADWSDRFVDDMKAFPNFYADLGYREELILKRTALQDFAKRLKLQPAAQRVMYGSDYFMMTRLDGWQTYAARMIDSLGSVVDASTLNRIRGQNAIACFGLKDTAPNSNGARLAARRGTGPAPRWAQAS